MVSWGPWNYRRNLNTVSCGEFTLVDVQKIWLTPHFQNRWIFGILYHQVDIFTIFCDILTIDFSVSLNNTTDPKTEKYTITQVDSKHKTFLTRDCMKGRFMTFYVTILKKKTIFWTFSVSCPAASMNSRTNLNAVSVRAIIIHALQEISTYNFKIGRSAQFSGCIESLFSQF